MKRVGCLQIGPADLKHSEELPVCLEDSKVLDRLEGLSSDGVLRVRLTETLDAGAFSRVADQAARQSYLGAGPLAVNDLLNQAVLERYLVQPSRGAATLHEHTLKFLFFVFFFPVRQEDEAGDISLERGADHTIDFVDELRELDRYLFERLQLLAARSLGQGLQLGWNEGVNFEV